jgi:hypothetical protein
MSSSSTDLGAQLRTVWSVSSSGARLALILRATSIEVKLRLFRASYLARF